MIALKRFFSDFDISSPLRPEYFNTFPYHLNAWYNFIRRMFGEISLISINDVTLNFAYLKEIFGIDIRLYNFGHASYI